jgi:phosphatidylglycerol:prolipoprotein diacylglycerol transferase
MQPTLIFSFIHSYGLMLAVGFYAAWWLAAVRAKAEGVDPDAIGNLVLISILAGVAGARALHVVLYRDPSEPLWTILEVWKGGLVFYGGLVAAVVADVLYVHWRRLGVMRLLDIGAPAVAIGQAFGRIGCFLNGCCYGGPCTQGLGLGVRFPAVLGEDGAPLLGRGGIPYGSAVFADHWTHGWVGGAAAESLPIHATQLYASVSLFAITALVVAATPYRRRYGELFGLMCILNALSRFGIELVRRDTAGVVLGLKPGQLGAIVAMAFGGALWVWARRQGEVVSPEEKCA